MSYCVEAVGDEALKGQETPAFSVQQALCMHGQLSCALRADMHGKGCVLTPGVQCSIQMETQAEFVATGTRLCAKVGAAVGSRAAGG